jgi:hypothetical protein
VFGDRFDFFLGGSIWSHASKPQIERMLDAFCRDATPAGVFVASYLPADGFRVPDYEGSHWVGTGPDSDTPGVVGHRLAWIRAACERRGLAVEPLARHALGHAGGYDGQEWLAVRGRHLGSARGA